ncbi:VPLPA-CTERM sorting domain-containing protein [Roseobacter sp. S98]|uniref:VPLPA-CTERM sorting domain-containing protein n=1 Tax=Roseobacter algicola (ex Choi et al. 2025) (nom. illeg.) TaxID=3092138 RepID=UPI0035C77E0D
MWKFCTVSAVLALVPAWSFAATLEVAGVVTAIDNGLSGVTREEYKTEEAGGIDGLARGEDRASLGRAEGTSNYTVDSRTGLFRLGSFASLDRNVSDGSRAGGNIRVTLTESFVAQGTGTAQFLFDYDGAFSNDGDDNSRRGYSANSRVEAELSATVQDGNRRVTTRDRTGASQTFSGGSGFFTSFSEILDYNNNNLFSELSSISFDLVDGQAFDLSVSFFVGSGAGINEGRSNADFNSTGYLSFTTSDGLNLLASNRNFLADAVGRPTDPDPDDPTDVSAVPLPAGGVLLLAGLAGFAAVGRKGKQRV